MKEYGFTEGEDYQSNLTVRSDGAARRRHRECLVTLDMAKELSMVERTDKERGARRYFIAMEKAAVQMATDHIANGAPEAIPQEFFDAPAECWL